MPRKWGAYDSVRIATGRNVGKRKRINPIFQYEKSDGIARNIRVRGEKKNADDGSRTKSKVENRKLRSMQRTVEAKFGYKCISRITNTRTLRTVG
jgi:hypothetical protein